MKTRLSLKALAFLSLLLCWQVSFARDIVFTFNGYENETTEITVDGVTLVGEKGSNKSTSARVYSGTWRVYSGNNMTFTAPSNAQITKIVFNNNQIKDWTGNQNPVVFSNIQVENSQKLKSITVTIEETGPALQDPTCKFSTEIATCNLGETFTAPTFSTASTGKVTYSSSNPSVATVNSETGEVTIVATTTGTTTITAEVAATDTHYAGSASYTLAVVDPNNPTYSDMLNDFRWEGISNETMTGSAYNGLINITAIKGKNGSNNPTVNNNANDIRVYANSTLSIESSNEAFLSEVVFSITDVSKLGNMTVNQGTLRTDSENKTITWSGYATSFTITVPAKAVNGSDAARFCFDKVSAKFATSELTDPACAFSAETATYTLGKDFYAPTFTTVSDGEITYKSSNTNVATVDAEGNVTAIAAGTTTITATVAATDTYATGSASYTLTVVDPNILFSESFAESLGNFTVDQTDEIWSYNSDYNCAYANGYGKNAQNLKLISPVIDLTNTTGATLTFDHAAGYIKDNDLTKDFTLWIKEKDATEWTQLLIPIYADSWTFVNSGEISLNAYCGKEVQIAFNYMCTDNVASAWEIKNVIIKKAEPATVTIPVSDAGYATYFSNQAWTVADNMKAGIITGVENNSVKIDWLYEAGSVVPANTAVLIQAAASDYVCEISNDATAAPAENLLKGSATETTTEGENCLFYKLSYDNNGENLGFYWAAENGVAFTNAANKAYLALPVNIARNVRGFGIDNDGTTGIQQIESGDALVNVYSIDGTIVRKQVKESEAVQGLKKGIYIINGKKIIK